MISNAPSFFAESAAERSSTDVEFFADRDASRATFYGSGKVALRDGLATLVRAGENALLPAYIPDAVVEPLRDLGLDARYYAVEDGLAPDLADLEATIDDDTAAVLSVNYFGFPTPGFEELTSLLGEYDCYHVEDNAHGPFSVVDGTLLGTRGHLGFTSLRKVLPIPDGAVLYCNDERVADAYAPSDYAGVTDRFSVADCRYVLTSFVFDALDRDARLRSLIDRLLAGRPDAPVPGPTARYEAGKRRMSKLSKLVVDAVDPESIRAARRENYRVWRDLLTDRDDVTVLFETLPEGLCPQVCPVRVAEPRRFLRSLERGGVASATTWPRLSSTVLDAPRFETARRLARELVVLPVHQQIDPTEIEDVGRRLRG